jgi:tetrahydromethanopterin S-methyltransferase subunit C
MIRLRFLTSFTVYLLQIRRTISDFGVLIAIIVMVCVDALLGIPTPKLSVPTIKNVSMRIPILKKTSPKMKQTLCLFSKRVILLE